MIRGAFLAASAMLLTAVPAPAQETLVLSDQMLPRETFMYVSFPSVTQLKQHLESSSLGKLWDDPALSDFKAEVTNAFESELDEGLTRFQEEVGMTLPEFLQIPSGEVSFAISAGPDNTMGAVIVLDFGRSEEQVMNLLTKAQGMLAGARRLEPATEEYDGTELNMYRVQYPGPAPTPLAEEFGWFIKDNRLVVSNRQELLESVLANWSGENESFMDNDAYAYVLGKCQLSERSSLSTFFFDPVNLFTKLVQTGSLGQQATLGAGMALGVMPALGINQLKAIGVVSQAGTGDFESVTRSVFYANQPPEGLMQVMQFDQIEPSPPEWVKDNVHAYAATRWKIDEAFSAIRSLVDMFSGAGAFEDQLNRMSQQPPGIHIKDDIVDQLNGEMRLMTAAGDGEYGSDQVLIVLGVRDTQSASDVVTRLANQFNLQSRDFRGASIYEFPGPQPGQGLALAVDNNRLLFCIGGSLLEQVLRNDSDMKPLAQSDAWQKIARHFPSNVVSVQFGRPAEQYRPIYEMLRSGARPEQFPGSQEIFEKIDFSTLPPFEEVSKYIQPSGGYSTQEENGLFMEAYQLKSAE
ncbi:MAG: hypothetical protein Fues2KO_36100 [Fuerstiella sp.]